MMRAEVPGVPGVPGITLFKLVPGYRAVLKVQFV